MKTGKLLAMVIAASLANLALAAEDSEGTNAVKTEATESAKPKRVSVPEFLEGQKQLRMEVRKGEYGELSEEDMKLFDQSQATLNNLLKDVDDIEDLSMEDRVQVYEAQEAVKSVLTASVDSRPLCRRESTVGTHRRVTKCYTPKEQQLMRQRASEAMTYLPTAPLPSGG